jgi:cytochrome c oxidase subunit 4
MIEDSITPKTYYYTFAALMVLLALTIGFSYIELGIFSLLIALTIALIKAVLVVLYFMHVRHGNRLIWVFIAAGIVWLTILMGLTASDYLTRVWIAPSDTTVLHHPNPFGGNSE